MYRYVTIFVYYFTNKNIILSSIGYFGINIKSHRLMGFYIYLGSKPVDGNSLPNILALWSEKLSIEKNHEFEMQK